MPYQPKEAIETIVTELASEIPTLCVEPSSRTLLECQIAGATLINRGSGEIDSSLA
jgi:hypothetical protein